MGVTASYPSVVFGPPPGAASNRLLSKSILPSRAAEDSPRGEEPTGSMLARRMTQSVANPSPKAEFPAIREIYREFSIFEADPGAGSAQSPRREFRSLIRVRTGTRFHSSGPGFEKGQDSCARLLNRQTSNEEISDRSFLASAVRRAPITS